ncbi:30S ribosomal protein S16 [Buchnera aphidicola (Mindarus keteleerifoliae)]|uniref:30S ribosomal protein S16 n=1 Tax=Buchnera aphidicola TaxID=9 RepID=UPI0031B72932
MVKIRLIRNGAKKKPFYQIVITDSRKSRNGKFIEKIGFFDPIHNNKEKNANINLERLTYWKKQGAQLSERVKYIINQKNS